MRDRLSVKLSLRLVHANMLVSKHAYLFFCFCLLCPDLLVLGRELLPLGILQLHDFSRPDVGAFLKDLGEDVLIEHPLCSASLLGTLFKG